jgi:hypothetical protein
MKPRTLKIGDKFCASSIEEGVFTLYDVINNWAIALDKDGVPWVISGDDIDSIKLFQEVNLPKKGKK